MSIASPVAAHRGLTAVAERVRERLRGEQVDPARDPERATMIARSEVRRHNDFALARGIDVIEDEAASVRDILSTVAGYGPLQALLDDPEVEEIWINAPEDVLRSPTSDP